MRIGILIVAMVAAGCSGGTPTSPTGQAESVTWTVDGQSFTATSNGRGALRSGAFLSLTGAQCGSGAIIGLGVPSQSPGTYAVAPGGLSITWTPDARTGAAASEAWEAPSIRPGVVTSGSVTITSITSDWVSGSFTATLAARQGNRDPSSKTIQGQFELSFKERTTC